MKAFLGEMELSEKMAGLSVVRMPNQSLLTKDELAEILQHIKARRDRTWLATANQIANWWRERERVSIRLEAGAVAPLLTVTVKGDTPLQQGVTVWVNLPESGSTLRLIANGKVEGPPKITAVDAWRAAVVLIDLAPGSHSWQLQFDRPVSGTR